MLIYPFFVVTEMEIHRALGKSKLENRKSFCFQRVIQDIPDAKTNKIAAKYRGKNLNLYQLKLYRLWCVNFFKILDDFDDPNKAERLQKLKQEILPSRLPEANIKRFSVTWNNDGKYI